MPFRIEYTEEAREHLRGLSASERRVVIDSVEQKLADQPDVETRNRKPLRPNPVAPWELRIGNLRVFYDFSEVDAVVVIVAVGVKEHGSLRIGGEEVEL